MSRANAADIRRRVTNVLNALQTPAPVPTPTPVVQERHTGVTFQQFISNLNKRVVTLEDILLL